jgi:hypothetical protein
VFVLFNNESEDIMLVGELKKIVFYILNFFAIEKAQKSAKDGISSSGGHKDLMRMADGNCAGGVDGEVVGDVVEVEVGGRGRRRCGGWKRGDRNKVRSGEGGEGVV